MIGCIIQARMGSSRLPGKALMKSDSGKPLLYYVINQLRYCSKVKNLVIATTTNQEDDEIEKFANNNSVNIFRGKEKDVLDRYFQCAKKYSFSTIVRITSDCPLIDPQIVDKVIERFFSGNYDYVTNTLIRTFPIGTDVEVFSFSALERTWKNAQLPSEREHVTKYILNKNEFKIGNFECDENLSRLRWTVDHEIDLKFLREIVRRVQNRPIFMNDVLKVLSLEPELTKINSHIDPDEGLKKSRQNDEKFIQENKKRD